MNEKLTVKGKWKQSQESRFKHNDSLPVVRVCVGQQEKSTSTGIYNNADAGVQLTIHQNRNTNVNATTAAIYLNGKSD